MGEECPWCMGYGTQFWEQVVFYKGHSRREMGSQKSACACQASYQEGKTTTQECCPKHSCGEHVQEFKVKWSRTKNFYTELVKE